MELFLTALLILAGSAVVTALWAVLASLRPCGPSEGRSQNRFGAWSAALGSALGLVALFASPWESVATWHWQLPWGLPVGACTLGLDPLSRFFLLPVFGLGLTCALSGGIALRHTSPRIHNLSAHWFFFIVLLLGMAVVISTRDSICFMLAWEIMSLAPFFLIDFNDSDSKVRDAAWVYLVAAHLGAVALIAYFCLLWDVTGTTSLDLLYQGGSIYAAAPVTAAVLFVLAVLGFGAKAGLAPMHVWLPEAHPAAPSHVSALLSGAMINAGLYGVVRTLGVLAVPGQAPEWWGWCLLLAGLLTALMGILKALAQSNLKRLLAYSSVENMGLMFAGVGTGLIGQASGNTWITMLGFTGALLHMPNHAGFKGLLFLCAGEVLHSTGTIRMDQLGGLQQRLPLLGIFFALGAAAIACLPPLSGFSSEFLLALSMLDAPSLPGVERQVGLLLALTVLALISGLAAALYAKAYGVTFLGEPRTAFAANAHDTGINTLWPLCLPALACVAGGLLAPYFLDLAALTAIHTTPLPQALVQRAMTVKLEVSDILTMTALVGAGAVLLTLVLAAVRRGLLRRRTVKSMPTWGCGFQAATPRIQYTDASFSEPLARLFAPVMGLKVHRQTVDGLFPTRTHLSVSAPDRLRSGLFTPLFEWVERVCNACKIVQHGKIHLYILYILATVVGLLIWGLA